MALAIGERPTKNHNEIHQGSDAKESGREEPKQTSSDLADDKTMHTKTTQEETQKRQRDSVHMFSILWPNYTLNACRYMTNKKGANFTWLPSFLLMTREELL
jgi:hypothetical protein